MEKEYSMLCGFTYEGLKHDTFTLKEMTGAEQEAIHKADMKQNGMKVLSRLLAYCVTSIGALTPADFGGVLKWEKEVIRKLYSGDAEYMFMELRKLSLGNEVEINHVCPNPECKAKLKTVFDLDELQIEEFKGEEKIPFELPSGYVDTEGNEHKVGVMRLPKVEDKEVVLPVAKKNPAQAETLLLTRVCSFDDGYPFDASLIRALPLRDKKYLLELLGDNAFGVSTLLDLTCDTCGEDFTVELSKVESDFFI